MSRDLCACGRHWKGRCDTDFPVRTDARSLLAFVAANPDHPRSQAIRERMRVTDNATLRDDATLSATLRTSADPVVTLSKEAVCEECGVIFEPQRSTARYCDASCRQKAARKRK